MSSTRYAPTDADPDASPERFLASSKLRGINIGLNVVTKVARSRTEPERRAMIWLTNYANLRKLSADCLSAELDLDKAEIRRALTDPEADLTRFLRQVRALKAQFEETIPKMYPSEVQQTVAEGCRCADELKLPVEIIGLTRLGKTDCAWPEYLRMLDRALWIDTPEDESDRTLLFEFARALGIGTGTGKKACQLRPQIKSCLGPDTISVIFMDECHRLWPADIRCKPKRVEFVRSCHDSEGVGVILIATPQYSESANQSQEKCERWATGQWDGRVIRYHLEDTMGDADLRGIARHHEPGLSSGVLELLITTAKGNHGYAGAMVNVIRLAKFKAGQGNPINEVIVEAAIKQQMRRTRIEQLALRKAA